MAFSRVGTSRVEAESWQEILYRKNDSAIIAHKEKRLKRRASVEGADGSRLGLVILWGAEQLETVRNAISITLYHRNCTTVFAVTPHRALTVDTGGAGDPKFRYLSTVCPELAK